MLKRGSACINFFVFTQAYLNMCTDYTRFLYYIVSQYYMYKCMYVCTWAIYVLYNWTVEQQLSEIIGTEGNSDARKFGNSNTI